MSIIYLISNSEIYLFASISISTFVLWEFNPFVRFDGYWLLSDLTNTPNLLLKSKRILLQAFRKTTLKTGKANQFKITASSREVLLFTYGFINTFFILFLFAFTFITYQQEIIQFPISLYRLLLKIGRWDLQWQDVSSSLLTILLFYVLAFRFIINQYKSLVR